MQLLKVVLALAAVALVPSEGSELAAAVKEAVALRGSAAASEGMVPPISSLVVPCMDKPGVLC
jgi:hypothetical protein